MISKLQSNQKIISIAVLIIVIASIYRLDFFRKFYIIMMNNYDQRITNSYSYCNLSSIGFINYLNKKYKFKDPPEIINYNGVSEYWIFFKFRKKYDDNFIILLNEQKIYDNNNKKINIKNYFIIEKFDDCYLLKKNDRNN